MAVLKVVIMGHESTCEGHVPKSGRLEAGQNAWLAAVHECYYWGSRLFSGRLVSCAYGSRIPQRSLDCWWISPAKLNFFFDYKCFAIVLSVHDELGILKQYKY